MPAVQIKPTSFSGLSALHDRGPKGLAAIIRGLAIDNARIRAASLSIAAITDSSTGVAGSAGDLPVPSAPFDASTAGGAQLAAANTAFGKINNALKVLVNSSNAVRTPLGFDALTAAVGTEATANTVPALDKTVASASGTSAIDYATGRRAMLALKVNIHRLAAGVSDVAAAVGVDRLQLGLRGDMLSAGIALSDPGTATASATGASSVSQTAMNAFLTAAANDVAAIAAKLGAVRTAVSSTAPLSVAAG